MTTLYALFIEDFELSMMVRVTKWGTKQDAEIAYNSYSRIKREIRKLSA